tara:strand:- start:122 stop:937 length:816 start_codon:yes stop_codon:yes gene_type:complete
MLKFKVKLNNLYNSIFKKKNSCSLIIKVFKIQSLSIQNLSKNYSPEDILKLINPPENIGSINEMNEILDNEEYLTLIEKPFFEKISPIIEQIAKSGVEGDLVFIGIYRGGGALYLKSLFHKFGMNNTCWLFDSFDGFEKPFFSNKKNSAIDLFTNKGKFRKQPQPKDVQQLFEKYNLHQNLKIVEGFVEETLPVNEIQKIAFLHVDVDIYEPTLTSLQYLYPKLSLGGWVVIDDYAAEIFNCKEAVETYRSNNKIDQLLIPLGNYPVGWKK